MFFYTFVISVISFSHCTIADNNGRCQTQQELVELLSDNGHIKSDAVARVMSIVDRKYYVSYSPYEDRPKYIALGVIESAPYMHAFILELLKDHLKNGMSALDIGSASGYLTICMGIMVGSNGSVIGLEHMPEMTVFGATNLLADGNLLTHEGRVEFKQNSIRSIAMQDGPFDAINVSPTTPILPQVLLRQLRKGGRMVVPIGPVGPHRYIAVYDKDSRGFVNKLKISKDFYAYRELWNPNELSKYKVLNSRYYD